MNNEVALNEDPNANAIQSLNAITLAIAKLTETINTVFPQAISTSLSATSGSIAPTNFVGFLSVANPINGQTIKVPFYA